MITNAIGTDSRISRKYLKGGLRFGGTCFPRDVHAYEALAKQKNVQCFMLERSKKVNEYQNEHLINTVI
jgi:UDPglucose 6-dehydrogenase